MKFMKKTVAAMLLLAAFLPAFATTAAASTSNIEDTVKNVHGKAYSSGLAYSSYQTKDNSSAVYLKITSSVDTHTYVSVFGCLDNGTRSANLTSAGSTVTNVVCRTGVNYSVHNTVNENGYPKVQLGFSRLIPSQGNINIEILWSPDSSGKYNDATGYETES